jgi:hypothetical protein
MLDMDVCVVTTKSQINMQGMISLGQFQFNIEVSRPATIIAVS